MSVLAHDLAILDYAPFLPPLVELLLCQLGSAGDTLAAVLAVISSLQGRGPEPDDDRLQCLPMKKRDHVALGRNLAELIRLQIPKIHADLKALDTSRAPNLSREIEQVLGSWISDLFLSILPLNMVLGLMDSWLVEGDKVLLRYALAMVFFLRDAIAGCRSVEDAVKVLTRPMSADGMKSCTHSALSKCAFSFSFSRDDLPPLPTVAVSALSLINADAGQHARRFIPKVASPTTASPASRIANETSWIFLWSWVPPALNAAEIELVFRATENGFRLQTLYESAGTRFPLILLVKTTKGASFGAFLPAPFPEVIPPDVTKARYQGTGETFLFTLEPMARMFPWVGVDAKETGVDPHYAVQAIARAEKRRSRAEVEMGSTESMVAGSNPNIFKGGVENEEPVALLTPEERILLVTAQEEVEEAEEPGSASIYLSPTSPTIRMRRASTTPASTSLFVLATQKALMIGGGGKHVGLQLDDDLRGTSGECHTFHNVPLAGGIGGEMDAFEASEVEAYAFKV